MNTQHVADLRDTHTGDVIVVRSCAECWALINSFDIADHVRWHREQADKEVPK